MSPKDLKSVRFIDKMMDAGVRVFKIEGRARGPEYVHTVVSCYKEAIESVLDGSFTEEKKDKWDERLSTVFNRGFWDGYYQGQKMGEWTKDYGNKATEKQVTVLALCSSMLKRFDTSLILLIKPNKDGVFLSLFPIRCARMTSYLSW